MKLYKKNRGSVLVEFALILPLFLLVIAAINDIANYTRLVSNMDELAASVVNVPFYLESSGNVMTAEKMRDLMRIASKSYIVSYRLYVDARNTPKMVFCWTAVNRKGICWRVWMQDVDGSLSFANTSVGSSTFENFSSSVSPQAYSGAIGTSVGNVLVLEVFLDIKNNGQFMNLVSLFKSNVIRACAFSTSNKAGQIPNDITF